MFTALRNIAARSADLLEAQAMLAGKRLRWLTVGMAVFAGLGVLGAAAACGVLAGIVVLITPRLGLGSALLVVGGTTALAVLVFIGAASGVIAASNRRAAAAAAAARKAFHEAVKPHADGATSRAATGSQRARHGIGAGPSDPAIIASAAFAAVSIMGVRRAIGLIRMASSLAAIGSLASDLIASGDAASPEAAAKPDQGREATPARAGPQPETARRSGMVPAAQQILPHNGDGQSHPDGAAR